MSTRRRKGESESEFNKRMAAERQARIERMKGDIARLRDELRDKERKVVEREACEAEADAAHTPITRQDMRQDLAGGPTVRPVPAPPFAYSTFVRNLLRGSLPFTTEEFAALTFVLLRTLDRNPDTVDILVKYGVAFDERGNAR